MDGDGDVDVAGVSDGDADDAQAGAVMCPTCSTLQPPTQTFCLRCGASLKGAKHKKKLPPTLSMKEALLVEAVATRKAARSGDEFTTAFARERELRRQLTEARQFSIFFEPDKHPRDRIGQFVDVLRKLEQGHSADLPGGISVMRKTGHFKIIGRGGSNLGRTRSASSAAAAALTAHEAAGSTTKLKTPPVLRYDHGILRKRPIVRAA